MLQTIVGAVFFGLASYVGVLLAGTISAEPFDDGPRSSEPPIVWILCGAALIGASITQHTAGSQHVVIGAIVVCALSAIWCTDVRYGLVPDAFTLIPLAIVLGIALLQRRPEPAISAAVAFLPFAAMAALSKGRGMGWGDVKLAALGGAVLGFETALVAFAAGAFVAAAVALARKRRREVIAFAPYLAGAIGIALPLIAS